MLHLYKRGKVWHARGSVHGKKFRGTLDTQFREVAYQRMIDIELHGGRRATKWRDFDMQFSKWIEPHLKSSTIKKYNFVTARFESYLKKRGVTHVHEVDPEVLAGYAADRLRDKHPRRDTYVTREGLKSDLRILHRMLSYAVQCGYLEKNPVISPGLNTTGGKTMPFTQEEVERLLSCAYVLRRAERRAVVLTFLYTGLRISDVSALQKQAINLDRGVIHLKTKKRGKDVALALHGELRIALKEHLRNLNDQQRFSAFLFPTVTGRRRWEQSMHSLMKRIFEKAGIEDAHSHRFRDTFAVRLLEKGASLYDVSKLMGITMRVAEEHYSPYVKELQERGQRLVESLDFAIRKAPAEHTGT